MIRVIGRTEGARVRHSRSRAARPHMGKGLG